MNKKKTSVVFKLIEKKYTMELKSLNKTFQETDLDVADSSNVKPSVDHVVTQIQDKLIPTSPVKVMLTG